MDQLNVKMRQCRWLDMVKDYDCEILYHPGKAIDSQLLDLIREAQDQESRGSNGRRRSLGVRLVGLPLIFAGF